MIWKRCYVTALICAVWTSVLSGCASPTVLPESLRPVVPPNLTQGCPPPPPLPDSSLPATQRGYLRLVKQYRICLERHAALAAAVAKRQKEAEQRRPKPNPITDWY